MSEQIIVYGADWCADCRRSKRFLDANDVDYRWVDLESEPDAIEQVVQRNGGRRVIPTIVFPDDSHLAEPSDAELAARLDIG